MKTARFFARIALPLLVICTAVALLLAGVDMLTRDIISENSRLEKENAIRALYPSLTDFSEREFAALPEGVNTVYLVYEGTRVSGNAVDLTVTGFGGDLNMMVAITPDGKVGGVRVISHGETPGFGSRATAAEYLAQYIGLSGKLTLGEEIDAISGATVSSRAVLAGVNLALSLELGGDAS